MSRLVIMTVGKTHSGKTTFARELELVLQQAIVIDQDNHAELVNKHYKKLRPAEGPNTLKFSITDTIVRYAIEQSDLPIILSNANLNKSARADVLRNFHDHGFERVIVYFNLPNELLEERIAHTQRSHAIFRNASNFQEVLERQANRAELGPTEEEADYLFEIRDPEDVKPVMRQIEEIANRS